MPKSYYTLQLMKAQKHPDYEKEKALYDEANRLSVKAWRKKLAAKILQINSK